MKRLVPFLLLIALVMAACGSGRDIQPTGTPMEEAVAAENESTPSVQPTNPPTSLPSQEPTATETSEPTLTPTAGPIDIAQAGVSSNNDWESYTDIINEVEMALVPAGCFDMGSSNEYANERPVHRVCFEEPFWIDVYEVTNEQIGSTGNWSEPDRPRDSISWLDARAHCESRGARLPTEAEWEYAARGPDSLVYPWGNDFVVDNVVYGGNSDGRTWDVGSKPGGVSWVGAFDLSGNVWEWVNDWYWKDYYGTLPEVVVNPQGPELGSNLLRGGAWWSNGKGYLRAAYREEEDPTSVYFSYGFRCALSYQP